jgi:hypothetical protein
MQSDYIASLFFFYNTKHVIYSWVLILIADTSGHMVEGVGLMLLASWDCGFESHQGLGYLISCECYVLSRRSLSKEPITHPEESCQLWCV